MVIAPLTAVQNYLWSTDGSRKNEFHPAHNNLPVAELTSYRPHRIDDSRRTHHLAKEA